MYFPPSRAGVPPDFSNRIRDLRRQLGLTQTQMAERIGVSFVSVNRWENGQSRPSTLAWQRILDAERASTVIATPSGASRIGEAAAEYSLGGEAPPVIDFAADPTVVRVVAEGERLAYGHLFNPTFATETSLIDPLPHQRLAVYERMLPQPRLRFLLADDAGAGKTIMAGLYIREMLARRLVRRVLIVPPAGLVGNWERELRNLFNLHFRIVTGADVRAENPFAGREGDLAIVSVDTLAGERAFGRLKETAVAPYDLVIFDEAHKLSADREPDFRVRKTDRYRLGEALAGIGAGDPRWELGWACQHLLLLTATPHMGKDFPYYSLWRLLEPEVLSTFDAFNAYPTDARQRHFIRRTKEEMVRFDGSSLYPARLSDTLSYELSQGIVSEQTLYDETTTYINYYYNRAKMLNRSAARLAMSVFQRRLASSTYALLRSLERRLAKIEGLIADIRSGRLSVEGLMAEQRRLDGRARDVWEEKTADEEQTEDGREEGESAEDVLARGVVATSLADLEVERQTVQELVLLARRVHDQGDESKFAKLREVLRDPAYRDQKLIIFTEHRDTLQFLVRRLESLGFTGQVGQIHGGLDFREREEQIDLFRRPAAEGGATYLVATDAAGEGINLQFCWLMVNFDIPWNPARLEQRMGRIHRYGQKHDPVIILNLVAGKTREGRVLKTLLEKLERIRKEMRSDKVFDVVGRLFEGVSIRDYLAQALTDEGAVEVERKLEGTLTKEQVEALEARERRLYGDGGDVRARLPQLAAAMEREPLLRLLPGYVRRFVEQAAPLVGIGIEGNLDTHFAFKALRTGALDPLWPLLESYPSERRERLSVRRPANGDPAIFLHPGEPLFDRFRAWVCDRFGRDALRGAVFVDPQAERPYLFHLAVLTVERQADPALPALARSEMLACRLVGLRQEEGGAIEACPVEHLLLLKGGEGMPPTAHGLAAGANNHCEAARAHAEAIVAGALVEERRQALLSTLPERLDFLARGYAYQDAELAAARSRLSGRAREGDVRARGDLALVKERQQALAARREEALTAAHWEPQLIAPGAVTFLVHALVIPTSDPVEKRRYDAEVEAIAVKVARAYEEANGAVVTDVSTPELALAVGLSEHPGFDLLSKRPDGEERCVEVKGRARAGDVELTENEWVKACNLGERYWLHVVYDCASPKPTMYRVRDPFRKLVVRMKGGVSITVSTISAYAEA
ncbi:MAG: helicase-related protein [Chloroflexota bacterium]